MAKRKQKNAIPVDLAAGVLFKSDRTCCVCRTAGKPVQIHHIDEDPSNSIERNLAVLCFDCHTDTQVRGGFHRKLDGDQVILYRDDWIQVVARRRAVVDARAVSAAEGNSAELKLLTTTLDVLKEHQQYWQLAVQYEELGNSELRDKYVELALQVEHDDDTLIFLRSMQGRQDLIPEEVIKREVRRRKKYSDWSQLARLYEKVGDHKNAALNYCRSITESLAEGNVFSSAYYLKELSEKELHVPLFQAAYRKSTEVGDLWWRIRALQELGWTDELATVVVAHRAEIEGSGNSPLRELLYKATGDFEKLQEERRKTAEGVRIGVSNGPPREKPIKSAKKPKKRRAAPFVSRPK
jgi:hypothetical protein